MLTLSPLGKPILDNSLKHKPGLCIREGSAPVAPVLREREGCGEAASVGNAASVREGKPGLPLAWISNLHLHRVLFLTGADIRSTSQCRPTALLLLCCAVLCRTAQLSLPHREAGRGVA